MEVQTFMKRCYSSYFSLCFDKHFTKATDGRKSMLRSNFRKGWRASRWWWHGGLNVRAWRGDASSLSLLPLFCSAQEPTFRPASPSSIQPFWNNFIDMVYSLVNLNPVNLTMKISHIVQSLIYLTPKDNNLKEKNNTPHRLYLFPWLHVLT